MPDPRVEYASRLERHLKIAADLDRRHIRAGNIKLAIIASGIILAVLILETLLSPYWILAPFALLVAFIVLHERILRAKSHADTAVSLYRAGLARIDDKWAGTGSTGERFRDANHVYADDLDLFGRGCLFELLSTAHLPMGEERLASWLTATSPHDRNYRSPADRRRTARQPRPSRRYRPHQRRSAPSRPSRRAAGLGRRQAAVDP